MKLNYTPITAFTQEEIIHKILSLEAIRQGRMDLANLSADVTYPLTIFTDLPHRTNPIIGHKFLHGSEPDFISMWRDLITKATDIKIMSVVTGVINVALSTEDPSGETSGMSKVGTLTVDLGENRRAVDWSFFPYLAKKDKLDEYSSTKIRSVRITVDDPVYTRASAEFKVKVETSKISTKNEEFFSLSVYYEILLEDYK
jgi:hypothetical protein